MTFVGYAIEILDFVIDYVTLVCQITKQRSIIAVPDKKTIKKYELHHLCICHGTETSTKCLLIRFIIVFCLVASLGGLLHLV